MFLEPLRNRNDQAYTGWIEVICGCMFSGKTEELIRRLNRALIARQTVRIFKPAIDKRYHLHDIVSHNENSVPSVPVQQAAEMWPLAAGSEVIGIDEAQFFDEGILQVVSGLADQGKRVIVAGLDMDYTGKPFACMPGLMALAEFVTKVHAICMVCGDIASHSYRLTSFEGQVLLGEKEHYEARCRRCFNLGDKV